MSKEVLAVAGWKLVTHPNRVNRNWKCPRCQKRVPPMVKEIVGRKKFWAVENYFLHEDCVHGVEYIPLPWGPSAKRARSLWSKITQ